MSALAQSVFTCIRQLVAGYRCIEKAARGGGFEPDRASHRVNISDTVLAPRFGGVGLSLRYYDKQAVRLSSDVTYNLINNENLCKLNQIQRKMI